MVKKAHCGHRLEYNNKCDHLKSSSKYVWTFLENVLGIFGFDYYFLKLKIEFQKSELKFEYKRMKSNYFKSEILEKNVVKIKSDLCKKLDTKPSAL